MKLDYLVRNVVRRPDRRPTRIEVVEFPRSDPSVLLRCAAAVDDAGGPEGTQGEFLFACPPAWPRFSRSLGEPGSFDRTFAGVLAAVPGTRIGHDDSYPFLGDPKRLRELAAHPKRPLCTCPHRQLVAGPFCNGRPRFERRVSDVGGGVTRFQLYFSRRHLVLHRALRESRRTLAGCIGLTREVLEQLRLRNLRSRFPLRLYLGEAARGSLFRNPRNTDKVAISHHRRAL